MTVGLAKRIIDDTCLELHVFNEGLSPKVEASILEYNVTTHVIDVPTSYNLAKTDILVQTETQTNTAFFQILAEILCIVSFAVFCFLSTDHRIHST